MQSFHLPPPLRALREACPELDTRLYLANCSQGPLSTPVRAAVHTFLDGWAEQGNAWEEWVAEVEHARATFASLIGARPTDIAIGTSVSQLVSCVASALARACAPSRRRVVTSELEFPGVAQAWLALRVQGWHVEVLARDEEGLVAEDRFARASGATTALLSLPHVCYAHGALLDVAPIVEAAHAHGTLVLVDAYQAIGTMPIDVQVSGVDFLVAGTLKYLLGTAGIAFLYVNPTVQPLLEATVTGWFGRSHPFAFDATLLDYSAETRQFDLGTPPILPAYAAQAGMQLVADTGVEVIRAQIERLSTVTYDLAPRLGLRILGPSSAARKGAITALDVGSPERAHRMESALRRQGIIASARSNAIRLAPHGFTCEEEMEQSLHTVARLMHKA